MTAAVTVGDQLVAECGLLADELLLALGMAPSLGAALAYHDAIATVTGSRELDGDQAMIREVGRLCLVAMLASWLEQATGRPVDAVLRESIGCIADGGVPWA